MGGIKKYIAECIGTFTTAFAHMDRHSIIKSFRSSADVVFYVSAAVLDILGENLAVARHASGGDQHHGLEHAELLGGNRVVGYGGTGAREAERLAGRHGQLDVLHLVVDVELLYLGLLAERGGQIVVINQCLEKDGIRGIAGLDGLGMLDAVGIVYSSSIIR